MEKLSHRGSPFRSCWKSWSLAPCLTLLYCIFLNRFVYTHIIYPIYIPNLFQWNILSWNVSPKHLKIYWHPPIIQGKQPHKHLFTLLLIINIVWCDLSCVWRNVNKVQCEQIKCLMVKKECQNLSPELKEFHQIKWFLICKNFRLHAICLVSLAYSKVRNPPKIGSIHELK